MTSVEVEQLNDKVWAVDINGKGYIIAVSSNPKKKYDVFELKKKTIKKLLSFGSRKYEQYKDKLGFYSHKNHNDPDRRDNYFKRHHKGETNKAKALKQVTPKSAKWFSSFFLW